MTTFKKLKQQQTIIRNPARIRSDLGADFPSKEVLGQMRSFERLHDIIIPALSELIIDEQNNMHNYVNAVQETGLTKHEKNSDLVY